MNKFCVIFLWFSVNFLNGSARFYTRCGLTQELIKRDFPRSFIGHWVCLIENESGSNTTKITNKANGSKDLGLFQINNKGWCTPGKSGGKCHMSCEDLLNENLIDDSACAKKVYNEFGFQAWDGWVRNCKGRPVNAFAECLRHPHGKYVL